MMLGGVREKASSVYVTKTHEKIGYGYLDKDGERSLQFDENKRGSRSTQ